MRFATSEKKNGSDQTTPFIAPKETIYTRFTCQLPSLRAIATTATTTTPTTAAAAAAAILLIFLCLPPHFLFLFRTQVDVWWHCMIHGHYLSWGSVAQAWGPFVVLIFILLAVTLLTR
eukprot:GHVT01061735.1.p2 GENE.GHVT01061735.1~~GHVT01061735.1.p2  ORF type:complete len:118 (-),score=18.60 GHVT01061735.1:205-558(-)